MKRFNLFSHLIFSLVLTSIICLSACSSSIDSDAKKVAELYCKAQALSRKAMTGDMSAINESAKLSQEASSLYRKLEGKYTNPNDAQKFLEAYNKAIQNCD